MKTTFILITLLTIAIVSQVRICTGSYEYSYDTVCSEKVGTTLINKLYE